ncbi:MAG TPA: alcohol dehydrogenase catalytic domain-containing protein [Polyangiales bacterium]|nr:alcohol dehydrogenase catalytic domain-containing protein [Polyangiales bacterium]
MLALQRTAAGIELREIERPQRAPGEALVRVRMAGICSTDLEIARGYMGYFGTLGHELVGEVIEADDARWLGARVAGEINLACGHCDYCTRGLGRHCPTRSVLGILNKPGCFAEYVTLPERNLHRVPDHVPDAAACFIEQVAACWEVLEQVRIGPRDRVLVLGDGKLGQLLALTLLEQRFTVTLAGKHARKLELARSAGAETAAPAELAAKSFDVVIEATGSPSGMQRAVELVRPRGTLVLKSTYHGPLTLDAAPIVIDEITLVGSRCGPFAPAIASLAAGRLPVSQLIDATYPLARGADAFERAQTAGALKILLRMSSED